MAETMGNTLNGELLLEYFTEVLEKAYGYVKNLDSSLNDIRIVNWKICREMDI